MALDMDEANEYALAVEMGLPPGWRVRKRPNKGNLFFAPEGKRYSSWVELQQVLDLPEEQPLKARPGIQTTMDEPAHEFGLPDGWTVRRYPKKNIFFSPEHEKFTSLRVALELVGAAPKASKGKKKPKDEDEESKDATAKPAALPAEGKPEQLKAKAQEALPAAGDAAPADVPAAPPAVEKEAAAIRKEAPPSAAPPAAAKQEAPAAVEKKEEQPPAAPPIEAPPLKKRGGVPSQFPEGPATEFGLPDGWVVRKYPRKNVWWSPSGEKFTSLITALDSVSAARATASAAPAAAAAPRKRSSEDNAEGSAAADHPVPSSEGPAGSGSSKKRQAAAPAQKASPPDKEKAEKGSAEKALALEFGLPEGWRAKRRKRGSSGGTEGKGKYYFYDPKGNKLSTLKEVTSALDGSTPEKVQKSWSKSDGSEAAVAADRGGGSSSTPASGTATTSLGGGKRKRERPPAAATSRRQRQRGGGSRSGSSSGSSSSASHAEPAVDTAAVAPAAPQQQQEQAPSAGAEVAALPLLQLVPSELRFQKGGHSQTRTVRLMNTSSQGGYVAFKVMTNITTPHNAEPTSGALPPRGRKDVLITLHPRGADDPNSDKHAFLFQAAPCESREGLTKELWAKIDPKAVRPLKLPIRWVEAPPPPKEAAVSSADADANATDAKAEDHSNGASGGQHPVKAENSSSAGQQPAAPTLPEPWEKHWSEDYNMYFYWNKLTEESRWTSPEES